MTTNLDIIKRALKKIHALPAGIEPTAVQAAEGMTALQSMIVELIGMGSLGRLNDVLATSDYTARENERVRASVGVTVTIPDTITAALEPCWAGIFGGGYDYGFRSWPVSGNGDRPPRDKACIVVVNSDNEETDYVYSAYKGEWVEVQALTQQGAFPFAANQENGFAALLAERLADDYDVQVGPETKLQAGRFRLSLSTRYDSASAYTPVDYF